MRRALLALTLTAPLGAQVPIGAAQVDVTPEEPIRLSGYGSRRDESDGVLQRLKATALAFGDPPFLVIAVDNCGVPAALRARVAQGLAAAGLEEERLTIAATHTHNGPMLVGMLENLFSRDIDPEEYGRIEAYSDRLVRELIEVGERALAARAPGTVSFAKDTASFAANRRTAGGPTDHDVEVLAARSADDDLRAVVVNYACHCTTLGALDHVCGDWAGYAREQVEAAHPGAVCLVTIGCGADQNPAPRGSVELAQQHGAELARAVERALAGEGRVVAAPPTIGRTVLTLDLAPLPERAGWEARAAQGGAVGYHARKNLARLDRGEALPTSVEYPVQVVRFGEDLVWTFLPGEVVVDYSLRLKRELDASRLIVSAYANDVPGYVPSERVLREGGYEGGGAMVYYDLPGPYAPGLEQRIVDAVRAHVPEPLQRALGGDRSRTDGYAPLEPSAARETIEVRPGLDVVLAASEPLVTDPVAIDFGLAGELWVVEMRDYPDPGEGVPPGRVRRLVDDDGDLVFDRATTFLDGLPLPTDVKVWRDGVLVCAAPDVLFARDTDGDGVADEVETLLSGFATHNHQARVNSLRWGLDGWLYGANGLFGGTVTSHTGGTLELGGQDFRWKPDTGELEHATGLSQQGRCRDDFGRWFGCDNGHLVWHYPIDAELLAANPDVVPPPTRVDVCGGEDGARLFPSSPPVRRFLRGEADERVTSACGIDVYRDTALGEDLYGDLFVCEPVHNLVRRVALEPSGVTFRGRRAPGEARGEFLRSTDPWFRPVQVRTGPDGALWVVDMARYVIEHPRFIPDESLARYDVRAGEGLGRIWRVVWEGDALRRPWSMATSAPLDLLTTATGDNGPRRDLAHQLCTWRGVDPADHEWTVDVLAQRTGTPGARIQACALLRGEHVVLGGEYGDSESAATLALARAHGQLELGKWHFLGNGSPEWLFESTFAAERRPPLPPRDELDPYLRYAVDALTVRNGVTWISPLPDDGTLARQIVRGALRRRDYSDLHFALHWWIEGGELHSILALLDVFDERGESLEPLAAKQPSLGPMSLWELARSTAIDESAGGFARVGAIRILGRSEEELDADLEVLSRFLRVDARRDLRNAAIESLARSPHSFGLLLDHWPSLGPSEQAWLFDHIAERPWAARAWLERAADEAAMARACPATLRRAWAQHDDPALAEAVAALFGAPPQPELAAELERLRAVDDHAGSIPLGRELFIARCATCHRLDGAGEELGPDLAALTDRSTEALLVAIVDPSRDFLAPYQDYVVSTTDGRVLGGLVVEETSAHVRVRASDGRAQVAVRDTIEVQKATGRSFMTAGLTADLSVQQVADLLAFLRAPRTPPKTFAGNTPAPVRVDANGEYHLAAWNAAVHGPELIYEPPTRNLGYWHTAQDFARWQVLVEEETRVDVWLEWACQDASAGETFVLTGAGSTVEGVVAGTGPDWSNYVRRELTTITLPVGEHVFECRPARDPARSLIDLRRFAFVPAGADPQWIE